MVQGNEPQTKIILGEIIVNKYFKVLSTAALSVALLTGCGSSEETSGTKEEPKQSEQKPKNEPSKPKTDENGKTELTEVGQKVKRDAATAELMKIKQVNETVDVAPLKIVVKDVKVIKLTDVSDEFAENVSYLTDIPAEQLNKGFSYVQVQYSAENTSDKNIEWYDLMNVITDKGEQIDGQVKDFIYDDAEGESEFIGKVKKDYQDSFVIKNEDINKVKLVFGYTTDVSTYEEITPEQTVEYTFE
jgi:hypothetical protein